jgi:hypothetical protein
MVLRIFNLSHQIKMIQCVYVYIYIYGDSFHVLVADSMLRNYSSRNQCSYYP